MASEQEEILRVYAGACEDALVSIEACLLELERQPDAEAVNEAFRLCHTIKGDSRTVGFSSAADLTHIIEEVFEKIRSGTWEISSELVSRMLMAVDALRNIIEASLEDREVEPGEIERLIEEHQLALSRVGSQKRSSSDQHVELEGSRAGKVPAGESSNQSSGDANSPRNDAFFGDRAKSLRIKIDTLDRMLNLTGELAIARSRMGGLLSGKDELSPVVALEAHRGMDLLFSELQEEVMRARMVSIGPLFRQQVRSVRDLALSDGKRARLEIRGAESELDTTVIECLRECLGHLIRNAIAHGIETPDERERAGKDPYGKIQLDAWHEGGSILVKVSDDGRGLDCDRILARALEIGTPLPSSSPSQEEIANLIFAPGFSTRETASLVSGRGVGLDVVRERLVSLGGSVRIDSVPGEGSTVFMRLPLTLAIIDGFEVAVGDETYVIPLASVVECVDLKDDPSTRSEDAGVIEHQGRPLPYVRLRSILGIDAPPPKREGIVVVHDQGVRAGIAVDVLLGESQAVIKPMDRIFRGLPWISGSTILSDGSVALILDVPSLLSVVLQRHGQQTRDDGAVISASIH